MNVRKEGPQARLDSGAVLRAGAAARVEGLYVHVPFCRAKCRYCDFYSLPSGPETRERFVARLAGEAAACAPYARAPLAAIYIGGGTPSMLEHRCLAPLLESLRVNFSRAADCEFSVEANPETAAAGFMRTLRAEGVNRLSLGAQSFQPRLLEVLGRLHRAEETRRALALAREAGFDNLSLDLIFAIPGQELGEWEADLDAAMELGPEHVSCYSMTYEPDTPMARLLDQGKVKACAEELEAEMYRAAVKRLTAAGYEHYEISNFARPGRRCRHNLIYWMNGDWLGLGPGAASHVLGRRWRNRPDLEEYLRGEGGARIEELEELTPEAAQGEELMLRLRLIEGAPRDWLDSRMNSRRLEAIEKHIANGLLERNGRHLRLTSRGLLLANTVLADLL